MFRAIDSSFNFGSLFFVLRPVGEILSPPRLITTTEFYSHPAVFGWSVSSWRFHESRWENPSWLVTLELSYSLVSSTNQSAYPIHCRLPPTLWSHRLEWTEWGRPLEGPVFRLLSVCFTWGGKIIFMVRTSRMAWAAWHMHTPLYSILTFRNSSLTNM